MTRQRQARKTVQTALGPVTVTIGTPRKKVTRTVQTALGPVTVTIGKEAPDAGNRKKE